MTIKIFPIILLCLLSLIFSAQAEAVPRIADQLSFFENKIRPVLAENCYKCHAEDSEKLKGSFLIDSKAGWMRGGDTGQAIIPRDAAGSLLIKMINHEPGYEAMPPKSKLSAEQIKDFTSWISHGALL